MEGESGDRRRKIERRSMEQIDGRRGEVTRGIDEGEWRNLC